MNRFARVIPFLVITLLAAAVAAVPADAAKVTVTRTVPANLEFRHGANPENPGNCGATVFVRWKKVPGTTHATVYWHSRSKTPGSPYKERSEVRAAPFDDVFDWIFDDRVEPGFSWVSVSSSWRAGPTPSDCQDYDVIHRQITDQSAGATRAVLTVELVQPTVQSTPRAVKLPRSRTVEIGTVKCPKQGACTVVVPKTVKVRINRTSYTLNVLAPKRVFAGKRAAVRVRFPKAAATALTGRVVRPKVRVRARNHGAALVTKDVIRTVRR